MCEVMRSSEDRDNLLPPRIRPTCGGRHCTPFNCVIFPLLRGSIITNDLWDVSVELGTIVAGSLRKMKSFAFKSQQIEMKIWIGVLVNYI